MDEQQKAREALRGKYAATIQRLWKQPDDCPVCGSNAWNTGDLIQVQLRNVDVADPVRESALAALLGGTAYSSREAYSYIPVTCVICGYSMFFHTGVLDVRDEETVKAVPPIRRPEADPQ